MKQHRLDTRDAKRIIHSQHHILQAVPTYALPHVVRGFAKHYRIQKKVMLKAMAHYVRICKTL
jgi:hypothetical protein